MSSQNQTIKQRVAKLDEALLWFESEYFNVEDAVLKYEEAKKLAEDIIKDLNQIKNNLIIEK